MARSTTPPAAQSHPLLGTIPGPLVLLGFGSIGKGILPLLERHLAFDPGRFTVVDPRESDRAILDAKGIRFVNVALTRKNFEQVLTPLLAGENGPGFLVNLSVDTGSLDLMKLCEKLDAFYIDTVVEPWLGFYFDETIKNADRTNYALREGVRKYARKRGPSRTAVSCCGANPGMVSWFVKRALVDVARESGIDFDEPDTEDREGWAALMHRTGVKGIHVAERDTQRAKHPKPMNVFWNTWSVDGFISEGMQPAELGWGTHETWMPKTARTHKKGSKAAIFLQQPGGATRVRTWCPTPGPQYGLLVTHNEAISISDYFTVRRHDEVVYRPTCHYAYHPCNDAILSLYELFGAAGRIQPSHHVLTEGELVDGVDELGVLLYGHKRNAYWYGSQLSLAEARRLAPNQNATGLQVSSAVLAGMVWALENPDKGVVEAEEMDFRRCLAVQKPYLGPVKGYYTEWNPLKDRPGLFKEDIDTTDPWQFRNILVHER